MIISKLYFTNNIVKFNESLRLINWKKKFPESVFIRDHENLPFKSPYDIDLIIGEKEIKSFYNCLKKLAKNNSLILISKKFVNSFIVILFDLNFYKNKRNWIFFEIRTKYIIRKNLQIVSKDIQIYYRKRFFINLY